jgi:hypothetical protein
VSNDSVNCSENKIYIYIYIYIFGNRSGDRVFLFLGLFLNNHVVLMKVWNVVIFQGVQFTAVRCADHTR